MDTNNVDNIAFKLIHKTKESKSLGIKGLLSILCVIVSIVAIVILFVKLQKKSKELAALKHERDVAKENEERLVITAKVLKNSSMRKELLDKAEEVANEVKILEAQINDIEVAYADTRAKIEALQTWEDVESYLTK